MKTITITVLEFAQIYGCSRRHVNNMLANDTVPPEIVSYRKSSGTWLIEVLKSYYDAKLGN